MFAPRYLARSFAAFLFIIPVVVTAQIDAVVGPGSGELSVDVRFNDSVPVGRDKSVELLGPTGETVATAETNSAGLAIFRGLPSGEYQLRIRGAGVDDTHSATSVAINSSQERLERTIYVQRTGAGPESLTARVSAAELAVPDRMRNEVAKALTEIQKDRLDSAQKRTEQVLEAYPNFAEAHNVLGIIHMKKGEPADGKKAFYEALRLDQDHPGANLNLAKILVNENHFAEAERLSITASSTDPMNPEIWTILALTQLRQQKFAAAIASAQRTHALPHTGLATCHLIAAGAYEILRDFPKAAAEIRTYLAENPSSPAFSKIEARLKELESRR
jgi:tetratricopeptide (TPR) repeat protein